MINNEKIGQRIATLRKARHITQERLAEMMAVTGQAVSKWENGNALPDISLLPGLGKILGISLDLLLSPYDLFILEAKYGANGIFADVTIQLNAQVNEDGLCCQVSNAALGADPAMGLYKYLVVRYQNIDGLFLAVAGEGTSLHISPRGQGMRPQPGEEMEILQARYGCEMFTNDVTATIRRHFHPVKPGWSMPVNHEWLASPPAVDESEHLSLLYRNRDGVFVLTVPEGGGLGLSNDGRFFYETHGPRPQTTTRLIPGVPKLAWGQGQDCSYAGALTAALNTMGVDIKYETVMGVSGACWRLAFCHPNWDFSSVDGLVVYDHAYPAGKALGFETKLLDRVEKKDREQVRSEIVDSLNRQVPVLAIDLRVVPEWGVICGYSDEGKTFWCRTYFDDGSEQYLKAEKWPFILLFLGQRKTPPPARESLLRSLDIFVEEMNLEPRRGYTIGFHAYETWSSGLEDDERFAGLDPDAFRGLMAVNHFCYQALVDARRAGAVYLTDSLGLLEGESAKGLAEAAGLYRQLAQNLEDGWKDVPTEESCHSAPREGWTVEMRHRQAALLRQAAQIERQVEQLFCSILES